jgi:hypothetical protein
VHYVALGHLLCSLEGVSPAPHPAPALRIRVGAFFLTYFAGCPKFTLLFPYLLRFGNDLLRKAIAVAFRGFFHLEVSPALLT